LATIEHRAFVDIECGANFGFRVRLELKLQHSHTPRNGGVLLTLRRFRFGIKQVYCRSREGRSLTDFKRHDYPRFRAVSRIDLVAYSCISCAERKVGYLEHTFPDKLYADELDLDEIPLT
jgi:hypothetical protein